MWRITPALRPFRVIAAVAVALLVLAGVAACTPAKGQPGSDQKTMDAISTQIQTTLGQRPDVVNAEVGYQNNLDASERADVSVKVKAGTEFEPVIDDTARLIWQSKLQPLSSINIGVIDAVNLQRGETRRINLLDTSEKADLERKYGPRPK
jgi:hypothetical protein